MRRRGRLWSWLRPAFCRLRGMTNHWLADHNRVWPSLFELAKPLSAHPYFLKFRNSPKSSSPRLALHFLLCERLDYLKRWQSVLSEVSIGKFCWEYVAGKFRIGREKIEPLSITAEIVKESTDNVPRETWLCAWCSRFDFHGIRMSKCKWQFGLKSTSWEGPVPNREVVVVDKR
jgi:hypothetical protein